MQDAVGSVQSVLVLGGNSEIAQAIVDRLVDRTLPHRRARRAGPRRGEARWPTSCAAGETTVESGRLRRPRPVVPPGGDRRRLRAASATSTWCLLAFGVLGDQAEFDRDPVAAADAVRVNYVGAVSASLVVGGAVPAQGHGTLVVLSSVAGRAGPPHNYVYGSTKAGLDAFAQGLGDALVGTGARVVVVRPGFVHGAHDRGHGRTPFATTPDAVADAIVAGLRARRGQVWAPSAGPLGLRRDAAPAPTSVADRLRPLTCPIAAPPGALPPLGERRWDPSLRPKQWVKNVLVFAAPVAAGDASTSATTLRHTIAAFVCFCAAASGTYLFNDAVDVEADRRHPVKRHRRSPPAPCPSALAFVAGGRAARRRRGLAAFLTSRDLGHHHRRLPRPHHRLHAVAQAGADPRHRGRGRRVRAAGRRWGHRHRRPDLRVVLHRHQLRGPVHGRGQARRRAAPRSRRTRPVDIRPDARRLLPQLPRRTCGAVDLRRRAHRLLPVGLRLGASRRRRARSGSSSRSSRSPSPSSATRSSSSREGRRARDTGPVRPGILVTGAVWAIIYAYATYACLSPAAAPPGPATRCRPGTAAAAAGGLGADHADRGPRLPTDLRGRPLPRRRRGRPSGRARPRPRPELRRRGPEQRRPVIDTTDVLDFHLDPAATGIVRAVGRRQHRRALRALVPQGLLRPRHPGHPLRDGRRGHRRRHPRQEPPPRRLVVPPRRGACACQLPDGEIVELGARPRTPSCSGPPPAAWASPGDPRRHLPVPRPSRSSRLLVDTDRAADLDEVMDLMETGDEDYDYSVAWIDLIAGGRSMGRSVLTPGPLRHSRRDPRIGRPPDRTPLGPTTRSIAHLGPAPACPRAC